MKSVTVPIPLDVRFYREEGKIIAHSLDFDIPGVGDTREEAIADLGRAIGVTIEVFTELTARGENMASPLIDRKQRQAMLKDLPPESDDSGG